MNAFSTDNLIVYTVLAITLLIGLWADKGKSQPGYPQGLLETIIDRGTGQIHSFRLSNRHMSELALFYQMIYLQNLYYYSIDCIIAMKLSLSVIG